MEEVKEIKILSVGERVPHFELDVYFPGKRDFGRIKLSDIFNIQYPMAADPSHIVSKTFGVYDEETGLALRGTFIIDPDGKLRASEVNDFPVGRNSDELLRKLRAFKYVRENPNEVCPAKWEPGEKTLTPGKDLVGRVGEKLIGG